MLPLVFLLLFSVTAVEAAPVNTRAPGFVLNNSKGQKRALADYKGRVVLVNFWASWCAPCLEELPELNRLAADYGPTKFRVLAINVDPARLPAKTMLARLGRAASQLEILWDPKSKIVSAYHIQTMPSSFILDSHGVIAFTHQGFHREDPAAWRREINHLLGKRD